LRVVSSAAIAGKPAPTEISGVHGIYVHWRSTVGGWLASDPPQAAIKKRRKL
jgi:hypothetical protein